MREWQENEEVKNVDEHKDDSYQEKESKTVTHSQCNAPASANTSTSIHNGYLHMIQRELPGEIFEYLRSLERMNPEINRLLKKMFSSMGKEQTDPHFLSEGMARREFDHKEFLRDSLYKGADKVKSKIVIPRRPIIMKRRVGLLG